MLAEAFFQIILCAHVNLAAKYFASAVAVNLPPHCSVLLIYVC